MVHIDHAGILHHITYQTSYEPVEVTDLTEEAWEKIEKAHELRL